LFGAEIPTVVNIVVAIISRSYIKRDVPGEVTLTIKQEAFIVNRQHVFQCKDKVSTEVEASAVQSLLLDADSSVDITYCHLIQPGGSVKSNFNCVRGMWLCHSIQKLLYSPVISKN
jgi:hypothetical protein